MAEIELTYELALEFLSFLRVHVHTEPGDLNLLCLQGIHPDPERPNVLVLNDNVPDAYDDTIVLVYHDRERSAPGRVLALRGTVDPGLYYTRTEPHPQGAAHLTFGQHLYVRGEHKGHPALRAFQESNRVWRDKNGNFKPDEGECVFIGTFGVNIHAGGATNYIGKWSAGCINVFGGWAGRPWKTFMESVDIHFQDRSFLYVTVWRGRDLVKFKELGWAHRPSLCLGMHNPWVSEAQRLLKHKGCPEVLIDGDWRTQMSHLVRKFQTEHNLTVDGWVGPETWKALTA
ncbi:peptidoglycan-binding domain-containing protein [Archangium violaceum]|uniref:peptidoglycan-binding domain-containing protein n=1 Tax=Archangium violaceum TaxID=83451 RepID=UPI002B2EC94F|nr:peptidoglycan-binding domain-containing protein [Archangium gephyra]